MARDFNGSNQYGTIALDLSAYSTLTLAFWLYADVWKTSAGQYDVIFEFTTDGQANNGGFHIYSGNDVGSTEGLNVAHRGNVGTSIANFGAASRPATGAWHHYAAIYDFSLSTNEVNLYVDGVLKTASSRPGNSNNTGTFANSTLYIASRAGSSLFVDCKLADIGIYSKSLSADEVAALAKGYSVRRVAPASLIEAWPFFGRASPEPGIKGHSVTLTNSPAQADHPPIILPRRAQVFVPLVVTGGAVSHEFTTPSFGFTGISISPSLLTIFSTPSVNIVPQNPAPSTSTSFTSAAFNFTANALSSGAESLYEFSVATVNLTAETLNYFKSTVHELSTALFKFTGNALTSTGLTEVIKKGGGMFMMLARRLHGSQRYRNKIGKYEP